MSQVLITKSKLDSLANTIAAKASVAAPLTIAQMETAVRNIPTGEAVLTTKTITANGTYNAQDDSADGYSSVTVNVPTPTPALQGKGIFYTPSETAQFEEITADSGYDGLFSVSVSVGAIPSSYVGSAVTRRATSDLVADGSVINVPSGYYQAAASSAVEAGSATTPTKTISITPGITLTSSTGVINVNISGSSSITPTVSAGWVSVGTVGTVSVSGSSSLTLATQAGTTVTPTENEQTAVPSYRFTTGVVKVGAISSTYVGSGITRRSATDLTASGSVVTVPSGYYSSQVTKAIAAATHPAPSISVSAAGLITASHTQAAGYVTAGTSTAIKQLTTQAAATITPTTSAQTAVASGRYTTGVVTVAAIPAQYKDISGVTATASDVVTGKSFVNSTGTVNGSLVIQHYYTGTGAPSAGLGVNGDIYLKTS